MWSLSCYNYFLNKLLPDSISMSLDVSLCLHTKRRVIHRNAPVSICPMDIESTAAMNNSMKTAVNHSKMPLNIMVVWVLK